MKKLVLFSILSLIPISAFAQTAPNPNVYRLKIFANATATTPIQITEAPVSAAICNLAPTPPITTVINPKSAEWNDPNNVGKVCRLNFSTFFGGLPIGTYLARFSQTDNFSLESIDSDMTNPFERRALPATLLNVRIIGS